MEKLKPYIESHIQNHKVSDFEALKYIAKRIGKPTNKNYVRRDKHLYNLLAERKKKNMYITCDNAIELANLAKIDIKAYPYFHALCPFIIDWWNISHGTFNDGALCYYARYGDYHPETGDLKLELPLPMPNDFKDITYMNTK